MEKSGLFTKISKFQKCLCNASENHRIFKHNQKIFWQDFVNFERVEGNFENSFCVHSVRIFTKFLGDPYHQTTTVVHDSISFTSVYFIMHSYDLPAACVITDT